MFLSFLFYLIIFSFVFVFLFKASGLHYFKYMSQNLNKCYRCNKLMDPSSFDDDCKACRECMIKRRAYKEKNKEHEQEISKEWYNNNKEEKAKYYQDNKEAITVYKTEKINCDRCGSVVGRTSIAKHKTSTKCKTLNEKKNEII